MSARVASIADLPTGENAMFAARFAILATQSSKTCRAICRNKRNMMNLQKGRAFLKLLLLKGNSY